MQYLFHYYEKSIGAFNNLSELPPNVAQEIQNSLKGVFAAQRNDNYLIRRRYLENLVRTMFIAKGGKPERKTPYYMVVGECPWLESWYIKSEFTKIAIREFDTATLSFTYGDTFPTFSEKISDNLEFRKQVYTFEEILKIINKYGLPQHSWKEPIFAQPSYIEVQVWSDYPVSKYRK